MNEIFDDHNYGRRFIQRNYKEALKKLEAEGRIVCTPAADERKKNTMADAVKCTFPRLKMKKR